MTKATTVYFFPNGNVACCDQYGQQIPELQAPFFLAWIEFMIAKGYNPEDLKEINLPSGRAKLITFTDDEGKTQYNWQSL